MHPVRWIPAPRLENGTADQDDKPAGGDSGRPVPSPTQGFAKGFPEGYPYAIGNLANLLSVARRSPVEGREEVGSRHVTQHPPGAIARQGIPTLAAQVSTSPRLYGFPQYPIYPLPHIQLLGEKVMANRQLSKQEIELANTLLAEIRSSLEELSKGDKDLLFAFRRKVFKELMYDERSKPMVRRKLKDQKWKEQRGLCAICGKDLPIRYTVLDRLNAVAGYTKENTRLIHRECDAKHQEEKGFA